MADFFFFTDPTASFGMTHFRTIISHGKLRLFKKKANICTQLSTNEFKQNEYKLKKEFYQQLSAGIRAINNGVGDALG